MAWDLYGLHYEGDSAERYDSLNNYTFYRGGCLANTISDNTILDCTLACIVKHLYSWRICPIMILYLH